MTPRGVFAGTRGRGRGLSIGAHCRVSRSHSGRNVSPLSPVPALNKSNKIVKKYGSMVVSPFLSGG